MRRLLGWALTLGALGLAGCGQKTVRVYQPPLAPSYPVPVPGGGGDRDGTVAGEARAPSPAPVTAMPEVPVDGRLVSTETGLASWYGTVYDRRKSANGEVYDKDAMTGASRTLPLGVLAKVTNLTTGQAAVVRITDRGPFVPGRILDLSEGAAKAVGLYRTGVGQVRVEAYEPTGFVEAPGRWCVQIGAFLDPDDAQQMKNDLTRRYATAKVIAFKGPTGSWVRLTLPVPDRDRSAEVAATVRVPDPGVEAYVTRTN